jgi:hypothetical protein
MEFSWSSPPLWPGNMLRRLIDGRRSRNSTECQENS